MSISGGATLSAASANFTDLYRGAVHCASTVLHAASRPAMMAHSASAGLRMCIRLWCIGGWCRLVTGGPAEDERHEALGWGGPRRQRDPARRQQGKGDTRSSSSRHVSRSSSCPRARALARCWLRCRRRTIGGIRRSWSHGGPALRTHSRDGCACVRTRCRRVLALVSVCVGRQLGGAVVGPIGRWLPLCSRTTVQRVSPKRKTRPNRRTTGHTQRQTPTRAQRSATRCMDWCTHAPSWTGHAIDLAEQTNAAEAASSHGHRH